MACFAAIASLSCSFAAEHPDTLRLSEVQVSAPAVAVPRISSSGAVSVSRKAFGAAPRAFGEADPVRFLALLPGVAVASDYSAGLSVDGMDYSQNLFRLNGIPVHFPYHFGGTMSVFSPALYPEVSLFRSVKPASAANLLGGMVSLSTPSAPPASLSAEITAGMIASSAFFQVPVTPQFSVSASARVSYIDAIYSSLLRNRDTQAGYSLADADLCAEWRIPSSDSRLRATVHYNADDVSYTDLAYSLTTALRWHNILGGIAWIHHGDALSADNSVYFTSFHNTLRLDMGSIWLTAPTGIDEIGAQGSFAFLALPSSWHLEAAYSARFYSILPQAVTITGFGSGSPARSRGFSSEISPSVEASWEPSRCWRFSAGALFGFFSSAGFHRFLPAPSLSAQWRPAFAPGSLSVMLSLARSRQCLHQVGFSEMGMSSNFKIAASRRVPPQSCDAATLTASFFPAAFPALSLTADFYYKRVLHQPEYIGAVLDILSPSYLAEDYILDTHGHNIGASLSARVAVSRFSAMATYGYCRTRRRIPSEPLPFSSSHELRHTLSALASFRLDSRWSFSATFNLASGRPYTPVRSVYFIGERLMMEYGPRNSARLPLYHRLDLSATYSFRTRGRFPLTHEVNLSVLNAYGRPNVEMRSFGIDAASGAYHLRDISSLYRFLPSVSYTVKY